MKYLLFFSIVFLLGLNSFSQGENIQKLYVGTFTSEGAEGIYLCNFNSETGSISLDRTFKAVDNPSFLKISPDKRYLYTVTRPPAEIEESDGFVSAYKIDGNGSIHFLNKQASNGKDPCYVDVSANNKFVAIATYGGGTISLYPTNENGGLLPATSTIINKGLSADKSRQTAPHAHSIQFSPFSNQVFSADLGTDRLDIFDLKGDKFIPSHQKFVKLESGSGPRHFEFNQNGKIIYIISELNSTITVIENKAGIWEKVQNISTLPADFEGKSYCADIHISSNGKYLYGSNRGHNSIAVFKVDPISAKLTFKETVSVEGDWPRNFALTADGNFMLVANQRSGNIAVFKMNRENGIPEFTGKEIQLPSPVCLEFL